MPGVQRMPSSYRILGHLVKENYGTVHPLTMATKKRTGVSVLTQFGVLVDPRSMLTPTELEQKDIWTPCLSLSIASSPLPPPVQDSVYSDACLEPSGSPIGMLDRRGQVMGRNWPGGSGSQAQEWRAGPCSQSGLGAGEGPASGQQLLQASSLRAVYHLVRAALRQIGYIFFLHPGSQAALEQQRWGRFLVGCPLRGGAAA